jgi:hypothetical protein
MKLHTMLIPTPPGRAENAKQAKAMAAIPLMLAVYAGGDGFRRATANYHW